MPAFYSGDIRHPRRLHTYHFFIAMPAFGPGLHNFLQERCRRSTKIVTFSDNLP
jgi:hypothetical protein